MRHVLAALTIALVPGCLPEGSGKDDAPPDPPPVDEHSSPLSRLLRAGSCTDLRVKLNVRTVSHMDALLAANKQLALNACPLEGEASPGDPDNPPEFNEGGGGENEPDDTSPEAGSRTAVQHSDTNTQVLGVDEADVVETDGEYLYLLSRGNFVILDVWPPEEAHEVSRTNIVGALNMFVDGDRAVIYSEPGEPILTAEGAAATFGPHGVPNTVGGTCPTGHGCPFSGSGQRLRVSTFDLSDRAAPKLLRDINLDGSFVAARRIGPAVHTVVEFPPAQLNGLRYWPEDFKACGASEEEVEEAFATLREANLALIEAASIEDWLPNMSDAVHSGEGEPVVGEGLLEECGNVWLLRDGKGRGYMSVVSQTMAGNTNLESTTILGEPGAVYASGSALYVASRLLRRRDAEWFEGIDSPEASVVHRFDLLKDGGPLTGETPYVNYLGSAAVPGLVLNQFAMDERGGQLRIATSFGYDYGDEPAVPYTEAADDVVSPGPRPAPRANAEAAFTILKGAPGELEQVGQVTGIGAAAQISAVRFQEKRAFLSFANGGPLRLLDFSDPAAPASGGAVPVEGTLRYIQAIDGDRVLTAGTVEGAGVVLQLIDLSDPSAPMAVGASVQAGGVSEAVTNHLAFNYYADKQALAIPMGVCEGAMLTFDGLILYSVSAEGFEERGRVAHAEVPDGSLCGLEGSTVKRSVFVEDYVLSISEDRVRISGFDMLDPVTDLEL